MGPILFIIYVNDTTLECSGNTLALVEKRLQNNVNNASNWLFKNNLIVNAKKSNVIIISHSPIIRSASLNITLDGNKLDQVPYVKLLVINIDANLDWKININSLSNSLSSKIGLLHRLSKFLPQSCLIILYTSLIQSVFD